MPVISIFQRSTSTGRTRGLLTAASYVLQAYFVQIGMPRGRPPGSKKPSLGAAARAAPWKSKTPDQKSDTPNDSRPPELANTSLST